LPLLSCPTRRSSDLEHPDVGFTRIIVGECAGGEGDSMTGFAENWDRELLGDLVGSWVTRGYMTGALMDVRNLVDTVEVITKADRSEEHTSELQSREN